MNEVIKMRLPDLGEGIDFATISDIGVAVGQTIKHDDIILVLERLISFKVSDFSILFNTLSMFFGLY